MNTLIIFLRIFAFLLFIAIIVYYIWTKMNRKTNKRRIKYENYSISQMKEIK